MPKRQLQILIQQSNVRSALISIYPDGREHNNTDVPSFRYIDEQDKTRYALLTFGRRTD